MRWTRGGRVNRVSDLTSWSGAMWGAVGAAMVIALPFVGALHD